MYLFVEKLIVRRQNKLVDVFYREEITASLVLIVEKYGCVWKVWLLGGKIMKNKNASWYVRLFYVVEIYKL